MAFKFLKQEINHSNYYLQCYRVCEVQDRC